MLPILALADVDVLDVPLRPNCNVTSYCFSDKPDSAAYNLSLNGGAGTLFLDWRSFGGAFFTTAGAFTNQGQFDYSADTAAMVPVSNISLSPLKPYIGAYLGVGWKGSSSNSKFMWMVDLGIVEQQSLNIVQNIQSNPGTTANDAQKSTSLYGSSKRVGFSFRMKF